MCVIIGKVSFIEWSLYPKKFVWQKSEKGSGQENNVIIIMQCVIIPDVVIAQVYYYFPAIRKRLCHYMQLYVKTFRDQSAVCSVFV